MRVVYGWLSLVSAPGLLGALFAGCGVLWVGGAADMLEALSGAALIGIVPVCGRAAREVSVDGARVVEGKGEAATEGTAPARGGGGGAH